MRILEEEKKFKSYNEFLKYMKKNNLSWNDKGPFTVELTVFKTVGDVLESYEE